MGRVGGGQAQAMKNNREVEWMDWTARDFSFNLAGGQSKVFTFDLQFNQAPQNQSHWHRVDGVMMADGRVMINREEYLKVLASEAGLEAARFTVELAGWIASQSSLVLRQQAAEG
jgi:hypothetical protein